MTLATKNALRLIEEGLDVVELDATDRTTDNIITLARAVADRGHRPKLLNAGTKTTENLLRIHRELGGNVSFSGI